MKPLHIPPPLDPEFRPPLSVHRDHQGDEPLVIALERNDEMVSRYETRIRATADPETRCHVERLVKFLLWARGGWRLYLGGPRTVIDEVQVRAFDAQLMERIYERPFTVVRTEPQAVPAAHEQAKALGGHLDGCRIGFDLGASDYKVAAVKDGTVVYTDEFPWNPKDEPDPTVHERQLNDGLRRAAAHLPRVDAIGGSSAGVIIDNRPMVASLFRAVSPERFEQEVKSIFQRVASTWNVPLEVLNDGDVTALAAGLSLGVTGVLGLAMGSSEATGFLDGSGRLTGWLNELAFAPADENPDAAADEWSGDRGVGALYFSQQAVNKLLPAARIDLPGTMSLPERLVAVQALMAEDDPRAAKIYETIGCYLGYTIPYYAQFYEMKHLLVLGRVTTGRGGEIIVQRAREVMAAEFPQLAEQITIHVPDEKSRRVGQAVAAASLPRLNGTVG